MFKIFFVPKKLNKIKKYKIIEIKNKIIFLFFGQTRIVPRSYVFPFEKLGIT